LRKCSDFLKIFVRFSPKFSDFTQNVSNFSGIFWDFLKKLPGFSKKLQILSTETKIFPKSVHNLRKFFTNFPKPGALRGQGPWPEVKGVHPPVLPATGVANLSYISKIGR
jgi:hypothetical protein